MRQLTFYFNTILTIASLLLTILLLVGMIPEDLPVGFLVILGIYQVVISFGLTIYTIYTSAKALLLYCIYWVFVTLFFKFIIHTYFYSCILIAIINLYIHYCSFSDSKYNIIKL